MARGPTTGASAGSVPVLAQEHRRGGREVAQPSVIQQRPSQRVRLAHSDRPSSRGAKPAPQCPSATERRAGPTSRNAAMVMHFDAALLATPGSDPGRECSFEEVRAPCYVSSALPTSGCPPGFASAGGATSVTGRLRRCAGASPQVRVNGLTASGTCSAMQPARGGMCPTRWRQHFSAARAV